MLSRQEASDPGRAGIPVAWREDWSFDEEAYRADLERICRAGVPSAGETLGRAAALDGSLAAAHLRGPGPFFERSYQDSALDHLLGRTASVLTMHPRSRPPYVSATTEDVEQLRAWLQVEIPELLEEPLPFDPGPAHVRPPCAGVD